MLWIVYVLTILTGSFIVYEDFRYRAVSWILFPVVGIAGIAFSIILNGLKEIVFGYFLINLTVIFLQLLLVKLYLYYRNPSDQSLSNKIGMGDVFFLIASSFFFSPLNFLLFLIGSLLFSLIVHVIFIKAKLYPNRHKTVPLAGLQSVFLIFLILATAVSQIDLTNDSWILNNLYTP